MAFLAEADRVGIAVDAMYGVGLEISGQVRSPAAMPATDFEYASSS